MKNETVKTFVKKFDEAKEQIIDIDVVLPDYYPEVNQILKCSASLSAEGVTFAGDKLSIAGNAFVTVVFTGEEGTVRVYEATQKYTKLIQCDNLSDGDKCFVTQEVTQLNYKATGPRRLEIRTTASVRSAVFSGEKIDVLSDFENNFIEQRCENFDFFGIEAAQSVSFTVSDTVKLPDGINGDAELISASCELIVREKKVIKNKVMLKGSCNSEFIVSQPGAGIKKFAAEVPFTEITEIYGAEEDGECAVCACCAEPKLAFKAMNGGNDVAFSADVQASVFVMRKETVTAAVDAFSVKGKTNTKISELHCISAIVPVDTAADTSVEADTYDSTTSEIVAAYVDNIRHGISQTGGNSTLNGTAVMNAAVKNSAGAISVISRTASFTCSLPAAADYFVNVACSRISAEIVGNGKIKFSASFAVNGFGLSTEKRSVITDGTVSDDRTETEASGIALYYAHSGEKLWDIAKENKCRVSVLKELNNLESEDVVQSCALIFPVGV